MVVILSTNSQHYCRFSYKLCHLQVSDRGQLNVDVLLGKSATLKSVFLCGMMIHRLESLKKNNEVFSQCTDHINTRGLALDLLQIM